jgi:hypothetical protein
MRLGVRKLRIDDVEKLQALVVENFDAIESGLTVLDARLLLGHATIDVIGVDTAGTLVLGAIGFSANEEMLLKAVEAYSWCLEYPESLVRLYPSCQLSEDRPPRLLFVVERVPDAFHRKIKQLGFPEVDCVEVRHLEFDGVAAVYFETLLRLRRGTSSVRTPEISGGAPVAEAVVESPVSRPAVARPTPVKLPKTLGSEPAPGPRASDRLPAREPAPVVSMVSRQSPVASPRVERPQPAPEPQVLRAPESVIAEPAPVIVPAAVPVLELVSAVEPAPAIETAPTIEELSLEAPASPVVALEMAPVALPELPALPEPTPTAVAEPVEAPEAKVSFKELAAALLGNAAPAAPAAATAPVVAAPVAAAPITLEPVVVKTPAAPVIVETPRVVEPIAEPVIAPAPVVTAPEPQVEVAEASAPLAGLTVEALVAAATSAPAAEPAKPMPALPQEFAGLNFPNDGVLTRQWMEFLNQMSSSK